MQIILLQKISNLGDIGEIKGVKRGFACNYLIPRGLATFATPKNRKMLESILEAAKKVDREKYNDALALSKVINDKFNYIYLVRQAASDGRLFGSVKSRDIAKILDISHNSISLKNFIKYTGNYKVSVILHPEVVVDINLVIASSEAEIDKIKNKNNDADLDSEEAN